MSEVFAVCGKIMQDLNILYSVPDLSKNSRS